MNAAKHPATIPGQGQKVNGPKEVSMARRRYQKGSLVPKTGLPRNGLWIGRWREDVIQSDGTITRPYKWEVLGTIKDYPTRKLALRALEARLSTINSPTYKARPTATFAECAGTKWKSSGVIGFEIQITEGSGDMGYAWFHSDLLSPAPGRCIVPPWSKARTDQSLLNNRFASMVSTTGMLVPSGSLSDWKIIRA